MSELGSFKITKDSQRAFEKNIREMQTTVKRDMPIVVKVSAKTVVFGLIKATKMGKGPTRGFAKSGWGVALEGLGVRPTAFFFQNNAARAASWWNYGEFKDDTAKSSPSVSLTNSIPFIEEVPGASAILPRAFHEGSKTYEKRLTKLGRKMAGKWAR
jgi:hypothetical protein